MVSKRDKVSGPHTPQAFKTSMAACSCILLCSVFQVYPSGHFHCCGLEVIGHLKYQVLLCIYMIFDSSIHLCKYFYFVV